jgi:NADH:ubiquinone oxidoreductase subunit C
MGTKQRTGECIMAAPASTQTVDLVAKFPDSVTADTRPGYSGFIVKKENLVEVATAIRDEFGFDLLTAVTGVDYLAENKMEVVYHAYKTTGGAGLVFRVQVDALTLLKFLRSSIFGLASIFKNAKPGTCSGSNSPVTPTCAAF